jgi:hypothetical protein
MTMVAAQTLYDWLLLLHVLAAMIWLGGGVVLAVTATRVLCNPEPGAVARFTASLRRAAPPSPPSGPPPATTASKRAAGSGDGRGATA